LPFGKTVNSWRYSASEGDDERDYEVGYGKPPKTRSALFEITTKEQDGYNKEYLPLVTKAITDVGGKFIVRGGKTISYEGAAPAPRVVVVQFESLDKLQALYNSAPYKDAIAVGDKYATQRIFGVEGVSP
jgi:uncharacterized protein (DUF1330 family)